MSDQKHHEFDLLVIGELNMDLILDDVESMPELGKEKTASDFTMTLGSSSAIFASNITRLGNKTAFCGMIGKDDFGKVILDELQAFGVDTSFIQASPDDETGLTVIIRHKGDRAMVTFPGAMEHFSLQHIDNAIFSKARHLHISSIFLQPGIRRDLFRIIDQAKSQGMTISIDTQWDPEEKWELDLKKMLQRIDFFLPNEAEFLNLSGAKTVKQGLNKLNKHVAGAIIVKRGIKGVTYLTKDTIKTITAFEHEHVVDAIGAGDSFNAGFIHQFLKGTGIESCVTFGNMTGAISTTEAGGTAAITSMSKVLQTAKKIFSNTDFDDFTG